jgi:hypothetical protein
VIPSGQEIRVPHTAQAIPFCRGSSLSTGGETRGWKGVRSSRGGGLKGSGGWICTGKLGCCLILELDYCEFARHGFSWGATPSLHTTHSDGPCVAECGVWPGFEVPCARSSRQTAGHPARPMERCWASTFLRKKCTSFGNKSALPEIQNHPSLRGVVCCLSDGSMKLSRFLENAISPPICTRPDPTLLCCAASTWEEGVCSLVASKDLCAELG